MFELLHVAVVSLAETTYLVVSLRTAPLDRPPRSASTTGSNIS